MNETVRENLRKGLDLMWRKFAKKKEEYCNAKEAHIHKHLEKIQSELNHAEGLLMTNQAYETIEAVIRASHLLNTLNFQRYLALFREANRLQQNKNSDGELMEECIKRVTAHLLDFLDQAEAHLDEGNAEKAQRILLMYEREKIMLGLAGPNF